MKTHLLADEGEDSGLVYLTEREAILGVDQRVLILAGWDLQRLIHGELLAQSIHLNQRKPDQNGQEHGCCVNIMSVKKHMEKYICKYQTI